jgi:hypothetical protein
VRPRISVTRLHDAAGCNMALFLFLFLLLFLFRLLFRLLLPLLLLVAE